MPPGLGEAMKQQRERETAPLWLPLGLYLGIIFGIGDAVSRYLQPVDWIGIIFVGLGLDWLLQCVWRTPARVPDTPAAVPPAAPAPVS